MNIITYEEKYRDNMISMVIDAKAALGLSATVNDDLYDVQKMLTQLNGTPYKAVYGYHNHQNHTN
ncbi:MAG: hypothetical protein NC401_19405 [Ruminococcus sp.]|nr:hypothetical protein [Ruminococcus sp.]